ncbi:MAG: DegT/DnrJ/EryC1/StrS family aminotransferase [Chloroflexi bacterium]|nr:DegT/DnrJ/EryC1/StrS family aminotransferase [Chloroflexota bacterium]
MSEVVIPVADPGRSYIALKSEIDAAMARSMASGWYILGPEVTAFEQEFAGYCGASHGVAVASGTDALRLALLALGIGPGDEVITVAHAGDPTPMAILSIGAIPRFVDVDWKSGDMLVDQVQAAIGPRSRAVLPVHLYGHPVELEGLQLLARQHGLKVIEDACQAHGAQIGGHSVGSIGDAGCFSFYPTKNLGAFGDAGMVTTNDAETARRLRLIRQYGWEQRNHSEMPGINSRMDDLQAAILRLKLRRLEELTERRRTIARKFDAALGHLRGVELPHESPGRRHVYHLYTIRCEVRDRLAAALSKRGIGTGVHYPVPAYRQPSLRHISGAQAPLAHTERIAAETLSLPLFPEMTEREIDQVASGVAGAFEDL